METVAAEDTEEADSECLSLYSRAVRDFITTIITDPTADTDRPAEASEEVTAEASAVDAAEVSAADAAVDSAAEAHAAAAQDEDKNNIPLMRGEYFVNRAKKNVSENI